MTPLQIKAARKKLGLTQKQAAELIGVSSKTWQQWELGQRLMHEAFWVLFESKNKEVVLTPTTVASYNEYTQKNISENHEELAKITHLRTLHDDSGKKFRFIDLFSGIGGIRQGFESVGGNCVFSSDIDPFAKFTYYTNFGVVPFGDITEIAEKDIPDHDLLCAGFPCQPFSHIGKREGFSHPTQGTMFHEILRIIKHKKPKFIFLENVPGLINHEEGETLKIILDELKSAGYHCSYTLLDAGDFGVPQNRKRFYLVGSFGFSNENFSFPKPPMIKNDIGQYIEKNAVGYSISKHLQDVYLFKKDDGRPAIVDQNSKGPCPSMVITMEPLGRLQSVGLLASTLSITGGASTLTTTSSIVPSSPVTK